MKKLLITLSLNIFCFIIVKSQTGEANVTVDWSNKIGEISSLNWGVNDYSVKNQTSYDKYLVDLLKQIKPGVIRMHQSGMVSEWTNSETQDWDTAKIALRLGNNYPGYGDAKVIFDFSDWPDFISTASILPEEKHAELAALYAKLPGVFKYLGFKIDYYEFVNENDETYENAGKYEQYCRLVRDCAIKLKEEVAKLNLGYEVKVGGPALRWPKQYWYETFIDIAGKDVDFISWHHYGSGPAASGTTEEERNQQIFGNIDWMTSSVTSIMNYARSKGCGHLETYLDEFNVQYVWTPYEKRHHNNVGAVWYASVIKRMALSELTGATNWNLKDGAYGLSRGGTSISAPGSLYIWGGRYLTGDLASVNSDKSTLELMAVSKTADTRSLLFINRSKDSIKVGDLKSIMNVTSLNEINSLKIDASIQSGDNWLPQKSDISDDTVRMAPWSLILITTKLPETLTKVDQLNASHTLDDEINLTWNNSNETNKGFNIYVDDQLYGFSYDTAIWVKDLNPDTEYAIKVVVVDEFWNDGPEESLTVKTLSTPLIINDNTRGTNLNQLNFSGSFVKKPYNVALNGDLTVLSGTGSKLSLDFKGTQVALYGKPSQIPVTLKITVDDTPSENFTWTTNGGYFQFQSPLLDNSQHTISVELISDDYIEIDFLKVFNPDFASDNQSPGAITDVQSRVTYKSIALDWSAPDDNSGIQGYLIKLDGNLYDTVFSPSIIIDNLNENTDYSVEIIPFDPALNIGPTKTISLKTQEIVLTDIYKTPVFITIDGQMDSIWQGVSPSAIGINDNTINDFNGTIRLCWNQNYLYLFAEIMDDDIQFLENAPENSDRIEVFYNAENTKTGNYGENDFWFTITTDGSVTEHYHSKTANAKVIKGTNGYTLEASFKWSLSLNKFDLQAGYIFGFEIHAVDIDQSDEPEIHTWHEGTFPASKNTNYLANLRVIEDPVLVTVERKTVPGSTMVIFPNPADQFINVELNTFPTKGIFRIYNLTGQIMNSGLIPDSGQIPVDQLQRGMYFIEIMSGETKSLSQFIKR